MQHSTTLRVDADPERLREILADLSTYPDWNDLVTAAVEIDPDEAGPAWTMTLRAQLGPLARSKQLRMVRTSGGDGTSAVRFDRRELDGRDHAAWVMQATVEPEGAASTVELALAYDGGLWTTVLDGVLGKAIDRATNRLSSYASGS